MTEFAGLSLGDIRPRFVVFRDRVDAGAQLAERLELYRDRDVLVLGIPRGGVPVAAEVADRLGAELDIVVARKLGAPFQPELALGAVTANGGCYLNEALIREAGVSDAFIQSRAAAEVSQARLGEERFRRGRPAPRIEGRTVIVVDDGLATGATMRAAVHSVRRQRPARVIVAVPVGAPETCAALRGAADEVVTIDEPDTFVAVGLHYANFTQTGDAEVEQSLARRQTSKR